MTSRLVTAFVLAPVLVSYGPAEDRQAAAAGRPVSSWDGAPIDRMEGLSLRWHSPRPAPAVEPTAPAVEFPSLVPDGKTLRMYGRLGPKDADSDADRSTVIHVQSANGLTWQALAPAELKLPAGAGRGFTPFRDARPGVPADERFKALGGSTKAGLRALAGADGRTWRMLADRPVVSSDAEEAFYGAHCAFWWDALGAYLGYVSELRGGVRVISRITSKDFRSWSRPQPIALNAPDEDIFSATVFPSPDDPGVMIALLTRTARGRAGPADIAFSYSRDGMTFVRPILEAWVRPAADARTWQEMAPSAIVPFARPRPWFRNIDERVFYAGSRRYELFRDRVSSVHAGVEEGELVTQPFIVEGNALALNFSTSTQGYVRAEVLDENAAPLPGYTMDKLIGNTLGGGRFMSCMLGDGVARLAWRTIELAGTGQPQPDWRLDGLKGRKVRLRLVLKDADVFAFRVVWHPLERYMKPDQAS